MTDGCKHSPPAKPRGYEISSFIEGPMCARRLCAVTSRCDSSHTFEVRNYHLYDVDADVTASAIDQRVEVCGENEEDSKLTQWAMVGKVPAAPYRPHWGQPIYGERRLSTSVHVVPEKKGYDEDVIAVDYSIAAPAGLIAGVSFNVPVSLT